VLAEGKGKYNIKNNII
jgi:hypothetical protein